MGQDLKQIVVLGGGYAGVLAAVRLARQTKKLPVKIILVDASDGMVERIRLHQVATGQQFNKIPYQKLLKNTQIQFLQAYVTTINPSQRKITLKQNQTSIELDYHRLIYALGSYVDKDSTPGVAEHSYTVGSYEMTLALQERLAKMPKGNLLICGGGLTGIESAMEIAESYPQIKITLVTSDNFASQLSQKAQSYLQKAFLKQNILIKDNSQVAELKAQYALLKDGSKIDFDLCLWAGKFRAPKIASESGLKTNEIGQMLVDKTLRSISNPEIYGAGDASIIEPSAEINTRMSCAAALPMGAHVADNILAELQNTKIRDFRFGFGGRCISLGRHNALIQLVEPDDTPKENIITGRLGVFVKEFICRYTIWSLNLERLGWFAYRWPQPSSQKKITLSPINQHSTT